MKNETTNGVSQSKIKACLAIVQAAEKEFNPYRNTEIKIREHLKENGFLEIQALDNKVKSEKTAENDGTDR